MALNKKSALVVGASRGIGRAVLERLLAEGYSVIGAARDVTELSENSGAETFSCDISSRSDRKRLAACATEAGVEAVVLSAATHFRLPASETSRSWMKELFDVNVFAQVDIIQRMLPTLRASKGHVVAIGSTLASRPAFGTLAYAASKAALRSATETFAIEEGKGGVRFNLVEAGLVPTAMSGLDGLPAVERAEVEALQLTGRTTRPEEIADAVSFLLATDYITGQSLVVDGGQLIS